MQKFLSKTNQKKSTYSQKKTVQAKVNRTGLPDRLKYGVERLSGYSMDNVRVHYNSAKPAQMQALAYTQGTDIHVAPGQERHLPHEAWHAVQQMQGRVTPTVQHKNVPVNDSPALEREADLMGARAARESSADTPAQLKQATGSFCVQRRPRDLSCKATVSYVGGGHVEAEGENDGGTAAQTVGTFFAHGLDNLGAVAAVTNPPGSCAEPHAVANALKREGAKQRPIKNINVSPARFTKSCKAWVADEVRNSRELEPGVINFGKAMIGRKPRPRNQGDAKRILNSSPKASYPPCLTCQQWIGNNGNVKPRYIVR